MSCMRTRSPNRRPLKAGKRERAACRVLALTLACSVVTGIAAEKESTDDQTAQEILERMATTYATANRTATPASSLTFSPLIT